MSATGALDVTSQGPNSGHRHVRVERWKPGPVTASRLRRTLAVYLLLAALGAVPMAVGLSGAWRAAGVGLWFPGAGFVMVGGWALLLVPVALGFFGLALFAWFGAGMIVAPLIVWLGSAGLAAALAGDRIWPAGPYLAALLLLGGAAELGRRNARTRKAEDSLRRARIEALPRDEAAYAARLARTPEPPTVGELSREDLAGVRYALDRALQPLEEFRGYDIRDIFQTAALRYQINHLGYALAQVQSQYAPNFHGYLSLAQRNLIEKYLLPRVWNYWVYESIWGHFNFKDWNPAGKDNVMLTGYFEPQVALYAGTTGDNRYSQPGALTFRLNDRMQWRHDVHSINASIITNLSRSPYGLYPCEPNWIYPACNLRAMSAIAAHDMAYGTRDTERFAEMFVRRLDTEFVNGCGDIIPLRSSLTGIAVPFPASDISVINLLNIFAPERARQRWVSGAAAFERAIALRDGVPVLEIPDDAIDFGNYRRGGRTITTALVLGAAQEFGDTEIAEAAQNTLDLMCSRDERGGVLSYAGSNLANLTAVIGRISRKDAYRRLHTLPPPEGVKAGPLLTEARYPDVLVARAVSNGRELELVLHASADGTTQEIGLSQLRPGASYAVAGRPDLDFKADERGQVRLRLALRGRTALHISPKELAPHGH